MNITPALRKYVLPNFPYTMAAWFVNKISAAYQLVPADDPLTKAMGIGTTLGQSMSSLLPSFDPIDLLVGVAGGALLFAVVYFKKKNAKKYRKDIEYGSARWGKPEDIKPYVDTKAENNIILTATESLTMNPRPANPKYARNKNVLVIGGSGSGELFAVLIKAGKHIRIISAEKPGRV